MVNLDLTTVGLVGALGFTRSDFGRRLVWIIWNPSCSDFVESEACGFLVSVWGLGRIWIREYKAWAGRASGGLEIREPGEWKNRKSPSLNVYFPGALKGLSVYAFGISCMPEAGEVAACSIWNQSGGFRYAE